MIEFYCQNCGQKINAPNILTGESRLCPRCKNKVIVPDAKTAESAPKPDVPSKPQISLKYSDYELTLLNVHEQNEIKNKAAEQNDTPEDVADNKKEQEDEKEEVQYAEERKLPWLIDIFLYPISLSGLKHLAIFVGVPMLMVALTYFMPVILMCLFSLICTVVNCLLFLYMFWYFAECIRDSADGWVRAPEGMGGLPDLSDMLSQLIHIIGGFIFFLLPTMLYILFTGRIDIVAWLLMIAAMFFYPISFLSVILHDSVSGLDPRILLRSIRNVFWPYMGLVLLFVMLAGMVRLIYLELQLSIFWRFVFQFLMFYTAFILAHLTGRFYWRYKEKLKWDLKSQ
jgi:DNA-directed RNA polymerase subunit RPC12/RpoP